MPIPYFHVDAFSSRVFGGNPAGVCPLEVWLPDGTMQRIAAENQHPETAFFVARGRGEYELRWFTPTLEIDLCGHATIASAHVLWRHRNETAERLSFHTKSGLLSVTRRGDWIMLDFPARPAVPIAFPADATEALGAAAISCARARDLLFVFESEDAVRQLKPDFHRIEQWDAFAVIATAPGREADFVSRFFAPGAGVPEDSATGSSHCTLIPYWAERLGKRVLQARQISRRGGEFRCELNGERVGIGGQAVTYLAATLQV